VTSGVHSDHPEAVPESFGHRSPESRTEAVGVVEQRNGSIAPLILERNLDSTTRKGQATTTDVAGDKGVRLGRHGNRS